MPGALKLAQRVHPDPAAAEAVRALGIEIAAFTTAQAVRAALLWPTIRAAGLSLGDCACLALASTSTDSITMTGDCACADLPIDTTVEQIR